MNALQMSIMGKEKESKRISIISKTMNTATSKKDTQIDWEWYESFHYSLVQIATVNHKKKSIFKKKDK